MAKYVQVRFGDVFIWYVEDDRNSLACTSRTSRSMCTNGGLSISYSFANVGIYMCLYIMIKHRLVCPGTWSDNM